MVYIYHIIQQNAENRIKKFQLLKKLCLFKFQTWFWFSKTDLEN